MDIQPLLEMSWPKPGENFPDVKSCQDFIKKFECENKVSLANLIDFGDREDTPSVQMTADTVSKLVFVICHGCQAATKARIFSKLRLSLSLVPRYSWAERFQFLECGAWTYTGGQDCIAEMREIRKDILR